jgi:predicted amidohydrolase YtcJ
MGIPHASLDAALALGLRSGLGDEWLRIGHLKIFTDGALGSQTAALEEPYEGTTDRGLLTIEPDRINADVARAAEGGIAVAIHAIGDRAVHVALDAIEGSRAAYPALRQRVEHVQLVRRQDLARFGALDVIASMQPIHATSDRDLVDRYWGAERATLAYPWRHLLDRGARLAFGSDAPVEPIDPLLGIHAAVARKRPRDTDRWHPEQALELEEAIAAYTSDAAFAMGAERERGTLGVGMRCDATVVERDLALTPVDEWPGLQVSATVVDGAVVYSAGLG